MTTRPDKRLAARAVIAGAPLGVWCLHFALSYALIALGCCGSLEARELGAMSALRAALLLVGSAALLAIGWLAWRTPRDDALHAAVRIGLAALAAVGVVWQTFPSLLLPLCRCG